MGITVLVELFEIRACVCVCVEESCGNVVGIRLPRDGLPRGRSSSPGRIENFLFSISSRPAQVPTQPRIQWVPAALSWRGNRQGFETDHLPPTTDDVKKTFISTSAPHTSSWHSA
jgi:hypothetical protein